MESESGVVIHASHLKIMSPSPPCLFYIYLEISLVHRGTQLLFVEYMGKHPGIVVCDVHLFCLLSMLHIIYLSLQIYFVPLPTLLSALGPDFKGLHWCASRSCCTWLRLVKEESRKEIGGREGLFPWLSSCEVTLDYLFASPKIFAPLKVISLWDSASWF